MSDLRKNRTLTADELERLFKPLFEEVRESLRKAAGDDRELLFALNRKLFKELSYLERGKPIERRMVKLKKFAQQKGVCPECGQSLPEFGKNADLDRLRAIDGYTVENTELIHAECHRKRQAQRGFA